MQDDICCHSCFGKLFIDRKLDNRDIIVELAEKYMIKRVVIFAYHL